MNHSAMPTATAPTQTPSADAAGASPSRILNDLSITAILGTDRASDTTSPSDLLTRAAIADARARAGHRPTTTSTARPIEPCPIEPCPIATPVQAALLDRFLTDGERTSIHEWCDLALSRGVRVPPQLVPILLEWWASQPRPVPSVMHAAGVCGTWLAHLNPRWNKPAALADASPAHASHAPLETWETGTPNERVALLKSVLQRDPDRALAMVQSTWTADGADERRKFIEALAPAISPRFEPLLEAALDDRAKTVRREAARALALLPASALRARMRDRASTMIQVERSKSGILRRSKVSITIEPPQDFDPSWERDAIEEKPSAKKGKRAFWMIQILSATDLSLWTDLSGLAPAEVIDALSESDYFADVVASMIESLAACPSQPDASVWALALVAAYARHNDANASLIARIWLSRPSDESETLRLAFLRASEDQGLRFVGEAATSDDRPWSPAFSADILAILDHHAGKVSQFVDLWQLVEVTSRLVHPSTIDSFERWCASIFPDGPSPSVQRSLYRARGRADMHKEFLA